MSLKASLSYAIAIIKLTVLRFEKEDKTGEVASPA
jgi:hypothetical protein